jgi:hypothetical protein
VNPERLSAVLALLDDGRAVARVEPGALIREGKTHNEAMRCLDAVSPAAYGG